MRYFGKSVNNVVIPEYSHDLVMRSIRDAQDVFESNQAAEKNTSLDFYYNRNLDKHIEQWFPGDTLKQIPAFPMRMVPRFARARMLLYKQPPKRFIDSEESDDYKGYTHHLNSKTREFAEVSWLLGSSALRSKWNEKHQWLDYDIIPIYKKYFIQGESDCFAISYEIDKDISLRRQFVFWSEARDGKDGMHFIFDQSGNIKHVNEDLINPYGIMPFSFISNTSDASDVVRAAVQIGIAMTEIALGVRFSLGQPVINGVQESVDIKSGLDKVLFLPEGSSFNYVSPGGSLRDMIESVKAMANQVAENNHLRIRWGESGGNVPSGEALKIMEIENLESRESDIPLWREWESSRYEVDRTIIETHTGKSLPENYSVDFGEVSFPLSPSEERAWLDWKLDKGIITKKDLMLHFNPDMNEEELAMKMGEVEEEKLAEVPSAPPEAPSLVEILQS